MTFFFPVFLFWLVQNEPFVADLWRGHAVWDGERVVDEEALSLGKVRDVASFVLCMRYRHTHVVSPQQTSKETRPRHLFIL